jgi:hypothetical protein
MDWWTGVLPLRAVAFQVLLLLVAIVIEGVILQSRLSMSRQLSMQYAAASNLLTVVVGWMAFFMIEPILPQTGRILLMSYIFFGIQTVPTGLILIGFSIFLAAFLLKLQGLNWFDLMLERTPTTAPEEERIKFKGRHRRYEEFHDLPNRPLAVLWANSCSFTAISLILTARFLIR